MIAAGLVLAAVAAIIGWPARHRSAQTLASATLVVSAAAFVVAGARGLAGREDRLSLGDLGGLGPAALHVDHLSGLFLVIACGVAVPGLCAAAAFTDARQGRLTAALALTVAAVTVIVTADNVFVLLFGWEALTVAFYLLVGFERNRPGRAGASLVTIVFGKASGAALLLGGLLLASHTHTFSLYAAEVDVHSALGPGRLRAATGRVRDQGRDCFPATCGCRAATLPRRGPHVRSWRVRRSTSASTGCGAPLRCWARHRCGWPV